MEGPGTLRLMGPTFELEGRVLNLSSPWLVPAMIASFVLLILPAYFLLGEPGLFLLLGLEVALLAVDFRRKTTGWRYPIRPPFGTRCQLSLGSPVCEVTLLLDEVVINGGSRPPTIQFQFDRKHLPTIQAGLFSLTHG